MMSKETADCRPEKPKELLPDILSHQDRVRAQRMRLSGIIKSFEEAWETGEKKQLDKGDTNDPNHKPSTVDEVYRGMVKLEERMDELIARAHLIQALYLGGEGAGCWDAPAEEPTHG